MALGIKKREFGVWTWTRRDDEKIVTKYSVSDQFEGETEADRPPVAVFPVSQLYDQNIQLRRARMLRDYLNRIQDVTEQAIANATLIDALTAPNSTQP